MFNSHYINIVENMTGILPDIRPLYGLQENDVYFVKQIITCDLRASSRPFYICKELAVTSIGKWNFWSKLLILDIYWQNYQNLSKSAHWPPQIPFDRGFLEN